MKWSMVDRFKSSNLMSWDHRLSEEPPDVGIQNQNSSRECYASPTALGDHLIFRVFVRFCPGNHDLYYQFFHLRILIHISHKPERISFPNYKQSASRRYSQFIQGCFDSMHSVSLCFSRGAGLFTINLTPILRPSLQSAGMLLVGIFDSIVFTALFSLFHCLPIQHPRGKNVSAHPTSGRHTPLTKPNGVVNSASSATKVGSNVTSIANSTVASNLTVATTSSAVPLNTISSSADHVFRESQDHVNSGEKKEANDSPPVLCANALPNGPDSRGITPSPHTLSNGGSVDMGPHSNPGSNGYLKAANSPLPHSTKGKFSLAIRMFPLFSIMYKH